MRSKIKAISFNLDDQIENFMYEYACELKQNSQSFSGLMKNLLMGYLINIGNPPPGIRAMSVQPTQAIPENRKKAEPTSPALPLKRTEVEVKGIKTSMPFSLDDED
jgi:hypothetical protein